ncbi:MAG: 2-amino-4-hydroxy-6-hydroxymethyldihydropteridine diphosphokinase [Betaproteobacteria bacterium]
MTLAERPAPVTAFVALGGNLDAPEQHIARGLHEMRGLPDTVLIRSSTLYRSAAVGYRNQPDFVNAVAEVRTALTPRALLGHLLAIEREHGRERQFPNAPRTLDLDIILYGDRVVREPGLVIPHPRMHERAFVVVPLAEIAPDAAIPGRGTALELLSAVDRASVVPLRRT